MKLALVPGLSLLLVGSAHAGVLDVGPVGSGHPFTTIQSAIDAAQSGDTVRVHAGSYAGFRVQGKALHIHGDGAGSVSVGNTAIVDPNFWVVGISGLALGSELTLAGMTIQAVGGAAGTAVRPTVLVENCAGSVTFHECALPSTFWGAGSGLGECLLVRQSSWALLSHSSVNAQSVLPSVRATAGSSLWIQDSQVVPGDAVFWQFGKQAVVVEDSALYVVASVLRGTNGASNAGANCAVPLTPPKFAGLPGEHAVEAFGTSIVKVVGGPGAWLRGGDAGGGLCPGWVAGGNAIRAHDATQLVIAPIAGLLQGGDPTFGVATAVALSETAVAFHGAPLYPSLDVAPTLSAPGASIQLEVHGNPQSPVVYFASLELAAAPIAIPGIDGAIALSTSFFQLGSKVLDAQGAASLGIVLPADPAFVGIAPRVQALEFGPTQLALTNPELVVLL